MALLDEELIPLTRAPRLMPGRPAVSTAWRWATRGFRGIVLETTTVAGRRFTSTEAVRRFCEATNRVREIPAARRPQQPPGVPTAEILRRAGIVESPDESKVSNKSTQ